MSNRWFMILAIAALWGIGELLIWRGMAALGLGMKSPVVSAWGILTLAFARGILPRPGSSSLMALIAASYKLLAGITFPCAFAAVMALGIFFDLFMSITEKRSLWIRVPTAALSVYFSFATFALVATYALRLGFWASGGLPNVLRYTLVNGSWAALFSLGTAIAGFTLSRLIKKADMPFWIPAGLYGAGWLLAIFI
ncbi:MAG: hypothetical protein ACP5QG_04385 [candidate division WOR-3 bacterium]